MARKFLDTSAVIKLYREEPDSDVVRAEVAPTDELLLSRLTLLEVRSAILGLVWQGRMRKRGARERIAAFDADVPNYVILPLSEPVLIRAAALIDSFTSSNWLKPPDAIQVASAIEAHAESPIDALVTTDHKQRIVAQANGLVVLPP